MNRFKVGRVVADIGSGTDPYPSDGGSTQITQNITKQVFCDYHIKPIRLKKSLDGDWHLALEERAAYTELDIVQAGDGVGAQSALTPGADQLAPQRERQTVPV